MLRMRNETNPVSPLQREVISAVIDGHDVFLQAATSFGKSLCFQLPAVVSHGGMNFYMQLSQGSVLIAGIVTLVVSPLLSLMVGSENHH